MDTPLKITLAPATGLAPLPHSIGTTMASVKELVLRQESGLGESNLVALMVFGSLTAALVLATMLLTLRV